MSYAGNCARVYAPTGKRAHLLAPFDSPNAGYPVALCGLQPGLFGAWLGTGTQAEHERAAALALCAGCAGAVEERGGVMRAWLAARSAALNDWRKAWRKPPGRRADCLGPIRVYAPGPVRAAAEGSGGRRRAGGGDE